MSKRTCIAIVVVLGALVLPSVASSKPPPTCGRSVAMISHYQKVAWSYQSMLGRAPTRAREISSHSCRYLRWVRGVWWQRAVSARHAYYNLPEVRDWRVAGRVVQRLYPGTFFWLMSCSGAEGAHGAWVRYGGSPYYQGYEYTGAVGGWLQYRWPTFKGHYRHALDDLHARGFDVPKQLRDPQNVRAWLSPLAQALAGGWGILHGQRSHWFASIGNGC